MLTLPGIRAVFRETENKELNELLKNVQEKIILPAYLPEEQRKRVFDPKKRQQLQQNPIDIELDGLEHRFTYIDRFKDVPNSKKVMNKAIAYMQTKEDWDNLETLLAGFQKAGIKIQDYQWAKLIRIAGLRDNIYAIIDCAKQSRKTGLTLNNRVEVVQLLNGINLKIIRSTPEQKKQETEQALKWADVVRDLMHQPQNSSNLLTSSFFVQGLMLFTEASAAQVKQQAGELDETAKKSLVDTVEKTAAVWSRHGDYFQKSADMVKLNWLHPSNKEKSKAERAGNVSPRDHIRVVSQILKGLNLAQELVSEFPAGLKPCQEEFKKHLGDFVVESRKAGAKGDQWAETYEEIMGQRPDWPASSS